MANSLIALTIIALVVQQIVSLVQAALELSAASDPTQITAARNLIILKIVGLISGVMFAFFLQFNLFPVGVFPETVSALVLIVLSGIVVGFGLDFALGIAKLGSGIVQVVHAQAEKVRAQAYSIR